MLQSSNQIAPIDDGQSLSLEHVDVRFAGLVAVDDVTLKLRPRSVTGLIGPNGAGKTTAVNVMTGFQRPTGGRILLGGLDLTGHPPEEFARRGIMRTFQSGRLFAKLSVIDNVAAAAVGVRGLSRARARDHAYDILEWMDCAHVCCATAEALPHGLQQRVGLARALAGFPTFLLLDEPASGLGRVDCDALISLIQNIPSRFQCGVLLIEHNMSVIMKACSSILVFASGRQIAEGTPAEISASVQVRQAYLGAAADEPISI
ncbi:ABC transporter ATP-binding protein [Aminobacter niigataensis]|uniref:ABC transporter ATP-binding protein n=1 Tax=Aminobacter niigataensis TaxID=83265 RepID=UPI0024CC4720|nr:ABC transporter ATP-binding protein [Aminobacter niigataensis]CAI2931831.1 ABC transporter domain-containing protein [Aminobacter niigataensis]